MAGDSDGVVTVAGKQSVKESFYGIRVSVTVIKMPG
jgi:hypothetical protein